MQLFKCLSEETRLHSIGLIYLAGELCVCDLCDALNVSQPKMSRHLAELKNCSLLAAERRGKWVYYRLHPQLPDWASEIVAHTSHTLKNQFNLPQPPVSCAEDSRCN
nr:metalloregulator ArsR/SmtB family transcription factor [Spongiibacter thalassae]